eukprot:2823898-Pyramimonas_sp.AAC.2
MQIDATCHPPKKFGGLRPPNPLQLGSPEWRWRTSVAGVQVATLHLRSPTNLTEIPARNS